LVPYVQFVGRIMRVLKQNAPHDPDNRGFIVSHIGLNVDRWWEDLRQLDEDDQGFYEEIAFGTKDFEAGPNAEVQPRRRFRPDMQVLEETIKHFVQEHFLEEAKARVDDLIASIRLRGFDLDTFNITRDELEKKLLEAEPTETKLGEFQSAPVSPQLERQEARTRLSERVNSAAKQLLNALDLTIGGYELPKAFPGSATNNLTTAIVLLNKAVYGHLGVGPAERDLIPTEQLRQAHDEMDSIIDELQKQIRTKLKK
jgi:DNA repair protein RadD